MEPNQANTSGAGNGTTDAHTSNQPEATTAQTSGSTTGGQGSNSHSADGKSWTEFANLQNLQKLTDQLPQGVRDFCTNSWGQVTTQVNKMSTTQKVAGAVALVGLGYLALRPGKSKSSRKQSRKNYGSSWDDTYRGSAYGSSTGSRYGSGSHGNSGSGSYGSQQQSGAGYGTGSDFGSGYGSSYGSSASSTAGANAASSAGSGEESTYQGSSLGGSSSAGRDYGSDV